MSMEMYQVNVNNQIYHADAETLKQWVYSGNILATDLVRKGSLSWIEASKTPLLREIFAKHRAYGYQPQPIQSLPAMEYNGSYGNTISNHTVFNPNYASSYNTNSYRGGNNYSDYDSESLLRGAIKTLTFILLGSMILMPLLKIGAPNLTGLLVVPLLLFGFVVLFIYEIKFLIAPFSESVLWGIAVLVLHPANLIFTIMYWQTVKRIVIMQLLGLGLVIVGGFGLR